MRLTEAPDPFYLPTRMFSTNWTSRLCIRPRCFYTPWALVAPSAGGRLAAARAEMKRCAVADVISNGQDQGRVQVAALCLLLLLAGIPLAGGQEASKGLIWSGVFTDMQARRGEATYQGNCAACHGKNLQATNPDAPSLTAPSFGISWHGKPVADLFALMRMTMPLGAGGSLSDPEYLDIVAYILKFNGYPAGDRELGPDVQMLKQIVIEPKK